MQKTSNIAELNAIAKQVRRDVIEMITGREIGPSGRIAFRYRDPRHVVL
jgi:hypothetical protein